LQFDNPENRALEGSMKTVSHISIEVIDTRPFPASHVKVPLEISKSYLRRCAGVDADPRERIERALADRPMVLLSKGSRMLQVWQEDGRSQTLTFDGRRAVIQDDAQTRFGAASVSALNRFAIARAMALRYARFDADARALITPCGVEERISPAIEFASPENWGFEKTGRGYQWTAQGLSNTTGLPASPPPGSTVTRPRYHDVFDEMCGEQLGGQLIGDRGDPLACAAELKRLRATAEVAGARGKLDERLSFDLAVAIGRCRLFGVGLAGIDDFTLTAAAARLAARRAIEVLKTELELTAELPAQLSSARTYRERDFVLERLEARMDLWAAAVALAEAEVAAGEGDADLSRLMRVVLSMSGRVDGNLQHHSKLLRPAAGTHLLTNWRRLLARGYRGEAGEALPWWLDGCIG
jgi:hypothetical protein